MNILQALNTNRPVKRKHGKVWFRVESLDYKGITSPRFSLEDVVAEDWEVQELRVEVTRHQICQGFADAQKEVEQEKYHRQMYQPPSDLPNILEKFLKKLGL